MKFHAVPTKSYQNIIYPFPVVQRDPAGIEECYVISCKLDLI
jgi:hypothetical protein